MSAEQFPYGEGKYDIGPYAKEYLFVTESDPVSDWTIRPDLTDELWSIRTDTTTETWTGN